MSVSISVYSTALGNVSAEVGSPNLMDPKRELQMIDLALEQAVAKIRRAYGMDEGKDGS